MPFIYSSSNNVSAKTMLKPGSTEIGSSTQYGICAGLTCLWVKNLIQGLPVMSTRPNEFHASILQAKMTASTRTLSEFMKGLFQHTNLLNSSVILDNVTGILNEIIEEIPSYWVLVVVPTGQTESTHAIGIAALKNADQDGNKFYFYDPNFGMEGYKTFESLKLTITMRGMYGAHDWKAFPVR